MHPARPVKRSLIVSGHPTSVSLEPAFWQGLRRCASRRELALNALVSEIDAGRDGNGSLSGALRLAVLEAAREGLLPDDGAA